MPSILALEPNRVQAGRLSAVVRGLHAELTLVTSIDRALQALTDSLPDLILIPALVSRKDETALTNRLRELGAAASHVQTLSIPILAGSTAPRSRGVLKGLRRGKPRTAATDGCEPGIFGAQITEYLVRATEARLAAETAARPVVEIRPEPFSALPNSALDTAPHTTEALLVLEEPVALEEPICWELAEPVELPDEPAEYSGHTSSNDEFADQGVPDQPLSSQAFADQSFSEEMLPDLTSSAQTLPELALSDQTVEFVELPLGLEEEPVGLEEPPLALDTQLVSLPDEFEPGAVSEPPIALDKPFVFEMPSLVIEDSWPEPQQIAAPELETISLSDVGAVSANDAPQLDAVVAPDPELGDSGAWWVAASIEDRSVPSFLRIDLPEDDVWTLPLTLDTMPATSMGACDDLPTAAADEVVQEKRRKPTGRRPAPLPLEVVFPPPEIITVLEDACATLVIPKPAAATTAQPEPAISSGSNTSETGRRKADAPRRKGDTTRRKTIAPVQDEWGLFDPTKCGFSALLEKLDEMTGPEKSERTEGPANVRIVTY